MCLADVSELRVLLPYETVRSVDQVSDGIAADPELSAGKCVRENLAKQVCSAVWFSRPLNPIDKDGDCLEFIEKALFRIDECRVAAVPERLDDGSEFGLVRDIPEKFNNRAPVAYGKLGCYPGRQIHCRHVGNWRVALV